MKTKIIKINSLAEAQNEISFCAEILRHDGLVVFPTETVYGLGASAVSSNAAEKIYKAKGRPSDNPLIIHVASPEEAEGYAFTSELYYKLAARFMPGPLTVIMPARESVPFATRGGLPTVAVRCPENEIARALISEFGFPIAAPSANLSGSPSPTNAAHVIDDMMGRVDVIIDGGDSDFGLESTIVKIDDDGGLTLLRPGKITPDDLLSVTDKLTISSAVKNALKSGEIAQSPGMKYRHYATKAPIALLCGDFDAVCKFLENEKRDNAALIYYSEYCGALREKFENIRIYPFGNFENEYDQAKLLFSILRDADKENHSIIYAPLPREDGIGLALYNRMIRAASHTIINL
jgi:L-threonylcarbamoyladenylate synthase